MRGAGESGIGAGVFEQGHLAPLERLIETPELPEPDGEPENDND